MISMFFQKPSWVALRQIRGRLQKSRALSPVSNDPGCENEVKDWKAVKGCNFSSNPVIINMSQQQYAVRGHSAVKKNGCMRYRTSDQRSKSRGGFANTHEWYDIQVSSIISFISLSVTFTGFLRVILYQWIFLSED